MFGDMKPNYPRHGTFNDTSYNPREIEEARQRDRWLQWSFQHEKPPQHRISSELKDLLAAIRQ